MSGTLVHMAAPSLTRVVMIDPLPSVTLGYFGAIAGPIWPRKDPGDTLDYVADYSSVLEGDDSDGLSDLSVQIYPAQAGDLRLVSSAADGARAVLWLTGGYAGTTYQVTLSAVTLGGRHLVRTVNLPVEAIATPPVPPDAITDQSGAAITTENNAPLTVE